MGGVNDIELAFKSGFYSGWKVREFFSLEVVIVQPLVLECLNQGEV